MELGETELEKAQRLMNEGMGPAAGHRPQGVIEQAKALALISIAESLEKIAGQHNIAVCPHGSTGFCMYCFRDMMQQGLL